jgi:hypothetical protein
MHAKGHPPGAILLTHYFTQLVSPLSKLPLLTKLHPRQSDVLSIWKSLSAAEKTSAILLSMFISFLSSLSLLPLYYLARFLYDKKTKKFYANEVNPMPGTLYHHLWKASGLETEDLVKKLIALAEEKYAEKRKITYTFESDILKNLKGGKLSGSKL